MCVCVQYVLICVVFLHFPIKFAISYNIDVLAIVSSAYSPNIGNPHIYYIYNYYIYCMIYLLFWFVCVLVDVSISNPLSIYF